MLQGVYVKMLKAKLPLSEVEFLDARYHPDSLVRYQFQRMIWENDHSCKINLVQAELSNCGKVVRIDEPTEGDLFFIKLDNDQVYRLHRTCLVAMQLQKDDTVAQFSYGVGLYLQKPMAAVPRPEKTKTLADFIADLSTKRKN
jgi:hypothetical protein